MNDPYIEIYFH